VSGLTFLAASGTVGGAVVIPDISVPEIETERLVLRGWAEEDLEALHRVAGNPLVRRALRRRSPTREGIRIGIRKMLRHWEQRGFGPWAAVDKESGRLIGHIGLEHMDDWPLEDKVEVGWVLHPYYWGRGLATEGGRASVRFGLENAGLDRIISTTFPGHVASRRVMEKCGLTYRGSVQWEARGLEVVWYAIDRE
jgi:RimJ/RimL family protein N-acetyltransferase